MKIKKFNESDSPKTLEDIIGKVVSSNKEGYYTIYNTENGTFTNIDISKYLDYTVNIRTYGRGQNIGEITLRKEGERYGKYFYAYFEDGYPKIISGFPGDERGCFEFNGTFIASGHDGNYLWNIETGEFKSNTW